jgi:quinol monooxygenase YgiN
VISLIAVLKVRIGAEAEFERIFSELTSKVIFNEPGNYLYQLTRSRSAPRTYKVFETYSDDAALEAHRTSDHYSRIGLQMLDLLTESPEIEMLDAL